MITVIGSLNMDLIARVNRLPDTGETLLATDFLRAPGAKGGNQAVAAARAGSAVQFAGCVGADAFGAELIESLKAAHVGTEEVTIDHNESTGMALIAVNEIGENTIIVIPGANTRVSATHVDRVLPRMHPGDLLVLQLEIPIRTVMDAAARARAAGIRVLLNPSPAGSFDSAILPCVDVLGLNETELALLGGSGSRGDPIHGARELLAAGAGSVVATLGEHGCVVASREVEIEIPALPVEVVDTTGAGDAFFGNLAHALAQGEPLVHAARFATAAAAWSVSVRGAQPSMPTYAQTARLLTELEP